ncbi:hypothetical protein NYR97_04720 [Xanthomonas hydrangeae]|uniref:DUF4154 domain-containing protein n=1 Tax=Xanthomonas hydrangeae TaxID=2775159 RepID=A0AAU0BH30_9XANT|nr:hypothetical protein [Xanthomonas hydrangeae]WOB50709.1 hypothetical protein NYR97_04720 [Xanthomonas hydrangeae]
MQSSTATANTHLAKEQADMRTAIPLVRSLAQFDNGEVELEFDVPAQSDDATPPVFIGILLNGNDPGAVADIADRLKRADVAAVVRLERVQPAGSAIVPLERGQRVGRGEETSVALAADGLSPRLFSMDADFATMEEAGLASLEVPSEELAFAYSTSLQAGRYRLKLHITRNAEELAKTNAQLLIAYINKGK